MSDLISREALLKALSECKATKEFSHCAVQVLINSAKAIEQGEAVYQSFIKGEGWFDVEKDDLDYVDDSYKRTLFTAPQQPQSVSDALEEAIEILTDKLSDVSVTPLADAIEEIRALIKRNAEG